jgi:hypothetical protein
MPKSKNIDISLQIILRAMAVLSQNVKDLMLVQRCGWQNVSKKRVLYDQFWREWHMDRELRRGRKDRNKEYHEARTWMRSMDSNVGIK